MARDGQAPKASWTPAQTSKISQGPESPDPSSSQIPDYGHPKFNKFMKEQMRLHSIKNYQYAGMGNPLGNFARVAEIMKQYPNFDNRRPEATVMMYILKHFDRIMWDLCSGKFLADDAIADIAVYMTILRCIVSDIDDGR